MTTSGFFDAIKSGDKALVAEMVKRNPSLVNARDGQSAIMTALYYNEPQIAQLLLEYNPQLDIFEAAATGQLKTLKALLDQNPDLVNSYAPDGFQPLGLAAFFGQAIAAAELIARGAEVSSASHNAMSVQPLHSAVAAKRIDITRMLLEAGANPNAVQQDGFTPMHGAAQNGDIESIALLKQYGAQLDSKSANGNTPYDLAVSSNHPDAAALLQP